MTGVRPNELARRQIARLADDALRRADVLGTLPTPLEEVERVLGIDGVVDMSELPEDIEAKKPATWKRILGAYVYRERVVFIDRSQTKPKQVWAEAHELGHRLIPWHEDAYIDDEQRLFGQTEELLEVEASLAGSHLIFQGAGFMQRALEYAPGLDAPISLSDVYGASMHVTIRHYAETHPDAVALIVAGRYCHQDGCLPIFASVESDRFLKMFGSLEDRLGSKLAVAVGKAEPLGDIVDEAFTATGVVSKRVVLRDREGSRRHFVAEAFFNQYNVFVLLAEHRAVRLGKRVRVQAS